MKMVASMMHVMSVLQKQLTGASSSTSDIVPCLGSVFHFQHDPVAPCHIHMYIHITFMNINIQVNSIQTMTNSRQDNQKELTPSTLPPPPPANKRLFPLESSAAVSPPPLPVRLPPSGDRVGSQCGAWAETGRLPALSGVRRSLPELF